jgi:putative heme transporter
VRHRWIRAAAVAAISVVAIVALLPRLTHAPWQAISSAWGGLTWWKLALLALLWAAGLLAHSTVLMGAMPGLTRRRAMTLNLTGSAVSNVLPLGGGIGVGLNYVMARRWGFSSGQFSLFTVLSNVWTVVAKAALPCLAVALLIAGNVSVDQRILVGAVVGSTVLALATGVALAIASSDRGARFAGRAAHLVPRFGRARHDGAHVEERLIALRRSGAVIVRGSWRRMTLGMVTYYALGALLLWASLHVVGSTLGPVAVLALFAFERALTTLPITPGGSGVAEIATTALAIAFSGPHDRAVVAAGVLLYRAFTFGLEIPVGGMWLLGWLLLQRSSRRPEAARLPVALGEAA